MSCKILYATIHNADGATFKAEGSMEIRIMTAIDLAKRAHGSQLRKYTREPYITHPFSVAGLVKSVTDDDDMFIAAILHDVVEDTEVSIETIGGLFGGRVRSLVDDLTDISKPDDGNRKTRKNIDLRHTQFSSKDAKTIKIADLIDNTKTIVAFDPDFARVYMREKQRLLEVLTEGNKFLYGIAVQLVEDYYQGRVNEKA